MLGPIRLAWWRERLEELDSAQRPGRTAARKRRRSADPARRQRGDPRTLEGGWLRLFDPFPWTAEIGEAIWFRGNLLFGLGARLLRQQDARIRARGGLWALTDAARHCSDAPRAPMLLKQARAFARLERRKFVGALRPLSALAALAIRDCRRGEPFEPEGTPGRAAAMLRHRFTGRLPPLC